MCATNTAVKTERCQSFVIARSCEETQTKPERSQQVLRNGSCNLWPRLFYRLFRWATSMSVCKTINIILLKCQAGPRHNCGYFVLFIRCQTRLQGCQSQLHTIISFYWRVAKHQGIFKVGNLLWELMRGYRNEKKLAWQKLKQQKAEFLSTVYIPWLGLVWI